MMITKIKKIENMGIFSGYSSNVPPYSEFKGFGKFNIIYGMNGVGKTTLSRLFEKIANKNEEEENHLYPNAKYKIMTEKGEISSESTTTLPAKIFNKDYIKKNISFTKSEAGSISLLLLGEDSIEKKQMLDKNVSELGKIKAIKNKISSKIKKNKADENEHFAQIARLIKSETLLPATTTYNSAQARKDYDKSPILKKISKDELQEEKATIMDEEKKVEKEIDIEQEQAPILKEAKKICGHEGIGPTDLEDLKKASKKIFDWVEEGIDAHNLRDGEKPEKCAFCLSDLSDDRVKKLLNYFSVEDKKLKKDIDDLIEYIDEWRKNIEREFVKIIDEGLLYEKFRKKYRSALIDIEKNKKALLDWIKKVERKLEEKRKISDTFIDLENIDDCPNDFFVNIDKINEIIVLHSKHHADLENNIKLAREKIKEHYLATIRPGIETLRYSRSIFEIREKRIETLEDLAEEENKKLSEQVYGTSKACNDINLNIKRFFGRQEIKFLFNKDKNGYTIERDSEPAENLSEGEKTAIALIYFMSEFQDKSNLQDKNDKYIVVIDDPVSSLDSNFLYNAFSLLTTPIKENDGLLFVEQIFILTHSFEFLKLLKRGSEFFATTSASGYQPSYLMIKNKIIENKRRAYIDDLDKVLKNFNSEYHYFFCLLYEFSKNEGAELDDTYPIPNMMRKVLEIFTEFQVVAAGKKASIKLNDKIRALEKDGNSHEIREIIKFINENSHGGSFEPNIALIDQSKKILRYMFEVIENENKSHYEGIIQLLDDDSGGPVTKKIGNLPPNDKF